MLGGSEPQLVSAHAVHRRIRRPGTIRTRQRRITDILNQADEHFLVVSNATVDEYGARARSPSKTAFAQVNLGAVLFAVPTRRSRPEPDLRTPKVPEMALISIPPFKITGRIHLLPERDLREALCELTGRFVPVTDATYWSDTVGEARLQAPMVAFNHNRAQILAPHQDVDPWSGLDRSGEAGGDRRRRRRPLGGAIRDGHGPKRLRSSRMRGRAQGAGEDRSERTWTPVSEDRSRSTPRSAAQARQLPIDGQVQAISPFGPAAVVDRDVVVARAASARTPASRPRRPTRRSRPSAGRARRSP